MRASWPAAYGVRDAFLAFVLGVAVPVSATVEATDDAGNAIVLPASARRIVSLAPHVTELLFAIGAGSRVVATVEYSDYPPAARAVPRIGGAGGLDLERIVALQPDLIVGWTSGNPRRTVERLRSFGFPVYLTEPRRLEDIARHLVQLGRLAGTDAIARAQAEGFMSRYRGLAARYAGRAPVRVFYQVLDPLLMTVNGEHLISEILRLCGGVNIFAALPSLVTAVGEEAVLQADPEAILAGGTAEGWRSWRARWRGRSELTAVKRGALYLVPADLLHRHSPRVIEGAEQVCEALEDARRRR